MGRPDLATLRAMGGPDLGSEWQSQLLSGTVVEDARMVQYYARLARSEFLKLDTRNFASIAENLGARLAMFHGMTGQRLEALQSLFGAATDLALGVDVNWEDVARNTLRGAAKRLDQSLENAATGFPVLGWIVEIGILVYDLAAGMRQLFEGQQSRGEALPQRAVLYDRDADADVVRAMLDRVGNRDWTPYFLPAVERVEEVRVQHLNYTDRGYPDGWGVEFLGPSRPVAWEVVPSLARISGSYYQARELPFALPLSSWTDNSQELGDVMPSACQLGLTMWEAAMKNGPTMFALDPDEIIRAWENYFPAIYGVSRGSQIVKSEYLRGALGYLSTWAVDQRPGQPGWQFSLIEGVKFDEVPAKYRAAPFTLDQIVTWQLRDRWEPRAWRALGTLTCAYVDERSPAIAWAKRSRPAMFERYESMRRRLLRHVAVAQVEPDMIPDREYRDAVIQAQRTPAKDIKFGEGDGNGGEPPGKKIVSIRLPQWDGAVQVDPEDQPEGATARPLGIQIAPQDPGKEGPGIGAAVVGIATVAAVAWYMRKAAGR